MKKKTNQLIEGSPREEAGESAAVERRETAKGMRKGGIARAKRYQGGGVVHGSGHHGDMNSRNVVKCEGMMGPRNP